MTTEITALTRIDDEIAKYQAQIEELEPKLAAAERAEADARADVVLGKVTEREADESIRQSAELIAQRRAAVLALDGLHRRRSEEWSRVQLEEMTTALEREVTPAALRMIAALKRADAACAEYGAAIREVSEASGQACAAWPAALRSDNLRLPRMTKSAAGFSDPEHVEFMGHLHALLCANSNEAWPYRADPPKGALHQSGAEFLSNHRPLAERFAMPWIGILEGLAGRPDLADKLRASVDEPGKVAKSRKAAA